MFVTHGAYDHLGDTVRIAETSSATVYTELTVANHLVSEGVTKAQVEWVIWGNAFEANGVGVRVLEICHLLYSESDGQQLSGMRSFSTSSSPTQASTTSEGHYLGGGTRMREERKEGKQGHGSVGNPSSPTIRAPSRW